MSERVHKRKYSLNASSNTVLKYGYATKGGYLPGNPGKVNQDAFIITPAIGLNPNAFFFGVADGHGYYGQDVSKFIKTRLPNHLAADPNFTVDNKQALAVAVDRTTRELVNSQIDCNFSGSTLVTVLIDDKMLWCANVGDSRALMARMLSDNPGETNAGRHWMSIALSRDHKPDDKDESLRIFQNGGRVEAYQDEEGNPLGPARVWLKTEDVPGLAMSRSIGDLVAASVGVIYEPETLEYGITPEDKFIVIGSDGIFEFLSNEEVVKIVVPYWKADDIQGACDQLCKEARDKWVLEEEVIDDITCVIVFLGVQQ